MCRFVRLEHIPANAATIRLPTTMMKIVSKLVVGPGDEAKKGPVKLRHTMKLTLAATTAHAKAAINGRSSEALKLL